MDPKACLIRLLDAVMRGDHEEAHYAGVDLLNWTSYKGGITPNLDNLSEAHNRILVKAVCWGVIYPRKLEREKL